VGGRSGRDGCGTHPAFAAGGEGDEQIHGAWLATTDPVEQSRLERDYQLQAFKFLPFTPLGRCLQTSAWRDNVGGVLGNRESLTGGMCAGQISGCHSVAVAGKAWRSLPNPDIALSPCCAATGA
jgi:hypothetical protein